MKLPTSIERFFGKLFGYLNISGRDATVFLLSLLLAFSIWLIHNLSLNYPDIVQRQIVAETNLEGHFKLASSPVIVSARCRTRGFELLRLKRQSGHSYKLAINPSDMHLKSGEIYYMTSADLVRYMPSIFGEHAKLEAFISDTVFFRFPYEHFKKVPVKAVYSVTYRPQFTKVSELHTIPDSILIYGEPSRIDAIGKVMTKSINLVDISSSISDEADLVKIDGVRFSESKVQYSLSVSRFVEMEATVQVGTVNVPSGRKLSVYPSAARVVLKCKYPLNDNSIANNFRIFIDYHDFVQSISGQCIPKTGRLPDEIISYKVEPGVFECIESEK